MLEQTGAVVEQMDQHVVAFSSVTWHNFACHRDSSVALIGIALETARDDRCIVAVSPDLRRTLLFWRWLGDWRLVRDLAKALLELGASAVEDNDS